MYKQVTLFLVTLAGWIRLRQGYAETSEPKAAVSYCSERSDMRKPYLLEENRVMKQQLDVSGKKLRLSNVQRRSLAKKAEAQQRFQFGYSARLPPRKMVRIAQQWILWRIGPI